MKSFELNLAEFSLESWISEYAQNKMKTGRKFNVVPNTLDIGNWAGQLLAFIFEVFLFISMA